MRIAIAFVLAFHGLLHVLGFLRFWRPESVAQLNGPTLVALSPAAGRAVGLAWLLASILFLAAAGGALSGSMRWWWTAVPALLLSQALIVLHWHDAWAGTLVNVAIALAVAVAGGMGTFRAAGRAEVRALLDGSPSGPAPVLRHEEIAALPAPVRRWLLASGAVGRPRARTVHLWQRGQLRTSPTASYMPAQAEQYFSVDDPGFVWMVDVTMAHVVPIVGRDTFRQGRGRMLIRAGALGVRRRRPVSRADGAAISRRRDARNLGHSRARVEDDSRRRDPGGRRRGVEAGLRRLRLLPVGDRRRADRLNRAL